jgi:hypothetical protein
MWITTENDPRWGTPGAIGKGDRHEGVLSRNHDRRTPRRKPREDRTMVLRSNGGKFVPNKKASGDWLLVGRTDGGRILTLVLVYQERRRLLRIFTGWASTDGERRRYL